MMTSILWDIISVVVRLCLIIQGAFDFNQIGTGINTDAIFVMAFVVPYTIIRHVVVRPVETYYLGYKFRLTKCLSVQFAAFLPTQA